MLLGWWPTASSPSASSPMSPWGRFPSRARRSESVSKYDLKYLLVPYWCCRCWSWTDIGRKEKQAGPILGWSHPLPTRSFLAGNVQAWMGVKCTPLVLVLHVIVHNLHLNKWCDQLLSIRRSWSLKIPLWRFGICTYCAGSSTCGGESFDNIQCVQKSPQFGPFPKNINFWGDGRP